MRSNIMSTRDVVFIVIFGVVCLLGGTALAVHAGSSSAQDHAVKHEARIVSIDCQGCRAPKAQVVLEDGTRTTATVSADDTVGRTVTVWEDSQIGLVKYPPSTNAFVGAMFALAAGVVVLALAAVALRDRGQGKQKNLRYASAY